MAGANRTDHAATVREHFAPGFSAGAGIAFVKASQPFDRAYGLCESLAKHAKDHAKAAANGGMARSLVSFHRLTTSVFENYGGDDGILEKQLALADGGLLTLNPYDADALPGDEPSAFPAAVALVRLARTIEADDFPAGPLRQVLSKATQHPATALADYQRWRKFNQRQDDRKQAIAAFDEAMGALLPGIACETTFFSSGNSPATPVFDALSLNAASRGDGE